MDNLSQQIIFWIEKAQKSLELFRQNFAIMSIDEKEHFIRHHAHLIAILRNVIDGTTQIKGINFDHFANNLQENK